MLERSMTLSLAHALLAATAHAEDAKPLKVDFARHVRPILSDHCFACHGPDEETREAGLRFDLPGEALKPTDSGRPAIVPGKPKESPLVQRISSKRPAVMMPPPEANRPLTDADRAVLRAWIEQGADLTTHWAFTAPSRPPVPTVKDGKWSRSPIDRFLLARMEAE